MEKDREIIPWPLQVENILPLVYLGTGKVQTSLSCRQLQAEHAIATTLISELGHPLLSSLTIAQEEPDLNRQTTNCRTNA